MKPISLSLLLLMAAVPAAAEQEPVEAEKQDLLSQAASALAVEELIVGAGTATIAIEPPEHAIAATETYPYLLVRGVWPVGELQPIDFEIERQAAASSGRIDGGIWRELELRTLGNILERTPRFAVTQVDPAATSPVFTAPLPERTSGSWNDDSHPRLAGARVGDLMLFRYPDFTAQPGHRYRYRVRLKVWAGDSAATESRWTAWSEPSEWAVVNGD